MSVAALNIDFFPERRELALVLDSLQQEYRSCPLFQFFTVSIAKQPLISILSCEHSEAALDLDSIPRA